MKRNKLWDLETPDEREHRYRDLFKQLDLEHTGAVDKTILKKALEAQNHPLRQSELALDMLFQSMDVNHDGHIDIDDFLRYVIQAELQIANGFDQIDKDHDGYIRRSEVSKYLSRIQAADI